MRASLTTRTRIALAVGLLLASAIGGAQTAGAASPTADPAPAAGITGVHPMNWTSDIENVLSGSGWSSRRWADEQYTEVIFTGCHSVLNKSVSIELHRDISAAPDPSYGTKKLTNCFTSSGASSAGEWTGLPKGNYYFTIADIDGVGTAWTDSVSVDVVYQDTTAAD
ncbi:hypothetical protein [Streptomyces sp. IBSBF 2435]|uniref:hypothetical protein n=1 Tax=Streptomyces sp. IBSBF 2435 TaxID=2903531 RepID=UPI002FDBC37B